MSQEEEEVVSSASICGAVAPGDTQAAFESQLRRDTDLYGAHLKKNDDMEYFSMLPLQPDVKKKVFERFMELEREKAMEKERESER
jgi:hypothetical protein